MLLASYNVSESHVLNSVVQQKVDEIVAGRMLLFATAYVVF